MTSQSHLCKMSVFNLINWQRKKIIDTRKHSTAATTKQNGKINNLYTDFRLKLIIIHNIRKTRGKKMFSFKRFGMKWSPNMVLCVFCILYCILILWNFHCIFFIVLTLANYYLFIFVIVGRCCHNPNIAHSMYGDAE